MVTSAKPACPQQGVMLWQVVNINATTKLMAVVTPVGRSFNMLPVQLALRISVCSTSVTDAGCSITSTATVSTTGATGCRTFRAAFLTGARLGLGLATVFACAALHALPRLAEFALRSFARFCTFDPFLRLAMITPWPDCVR
jgi:hypothetical protein